MNDVGELETIVEEIAIVDGEVAAVAAQDDASLHETPGGSEPVASDVHGTGGRRGNRAAELQAVCESTYKFIGAPIGN